VHDDIDSRHRDAVGVANILVDHREIWMSGKKVTEPLEVNDGDGMAAVEETLGEGSADITAAAGEENFHG
jgi:hypothetical protein